MDHNIIEKVFYLGVIVFCFLFICLVMSGIGAVGVKLFLAITLVMIVAFVIWAIGYITIHPDVFYDEFGDTE